MPSILQLLSGRTYKSLPLKDCPCSYVEDSQNIEDTALFEDRHQRYAVLLKKV